MTSKPTGFSRQGLFAGALTAFTLAACQTTTPSIVAPSLDYSAKAEQCSSKFDFTNARGLSDEKALKRAIKAQRVHLVANMGVDDIACTLSSTEQALPYASFELPTGMTGRVVSAGSKMDTAVIFAADVSTYDNEGEPVRHFERDEFRRLGKIYGVQFTPRENETYVVIQADPNLVGDIDSTVETSTHGQSVTVAYGAAVSSGTNTVGTQRSFDRTYSFNGDVAVITVFPKQEETK